MEIKGVLIDENFSLIAKKIVLTRNLLVHPYRKFSLEDLNSIIKDMLPEITLCW
ncbi:MAG: HepT-like ribonuclease domain-containing protein [Thermoproteota archaeon]